MDEDGRVKRTALKRKPKPRRPPEEYAAMLNWVLAVHDRSGGMSQLSGLPAQVGHHVVTRQKCRREGIPEWDPRNAMSLTAREHERHHSRARPILRSELPDDVWRFAADYGLVDYLERRYPESLG